MVVVLASIVGICRDTAAGQARRETRIIESGDERMKPFAVVICGAGVAGVEGLLRLRKLAGDRVDITLLSAKEEFAYRPMAVLEPFARGQVNRYPVAQIAADTGAHWIRDNLGWVDRDHRKVHTSHGQVLEYDALLLAVGGRERKPPEHVQVFSDRNAAELYRAIISDVESGHIKSLAFVMPSGPSWPLPLYELALLTAEETRGKVALDIAFITPDPLPMKAFGEEAGQAVARLLRDAGISLYSDANVHVEGPRHLVLHSSGTDLYPDQIVTLPTLTGPNVAGMVGDAIHRFLPIDARCRVLGTDGHVFAAGDATDLPVKHGSLGAQQADAAAAGIAHLAGVVDAPGPTHPVLRGMLLTGHDPLYLTADVIGGQGWGAKIYEKPPWPPDDKVIAEELGSYLRGIEAVNPLPPTTEADATTHKMRSADPAAQDLGSRSSRGLQEVEIEPAPIDLLTQFLTPERAEHLRLVAERARRLLADRIVWNVNATAHGGGVAEMLQNLLAYGQGAGVDTRWLVLDGDPEFFATTKRLHNALHGDAGDGGSLGDREHAHYQDVLAANLARISGLVRPHDLVLLHDPQTAGLVEGLRATGTRVIWRCHIGSDTQNNHTQDGWKFLRKYAQDAEAFIFSRAAYAPEWARGDRLSVIAPSIDPFSVKNREVEPDEVSSILHRVGLLAGDDHAGSLPFNCRDGSRATVRRHRNLMLDGPPPPAGSRLVVQVSRWDRLKDMAGVMAGFVAHPTPSDVHLMLVGPDVSGVTDDPEGAAVLAECRSRWHDLPEATRARVHLVCVPMDDADENALIVNAVQRQACVVVQKSLSEGFGLTVTEAMWKSRPVIASAVGGIQDQITNGQDGVLLDNPRDLDDFAAALRRLLGDPDGAARLGAEGHQHVRDEFLGDRHLAQYVDLFASLIA
jgi:trehalose synthase